MTAESFYAYWQLFFCGFAFLGLISIYWHIGRHRHDQGQVWLALAVLCWSLSGAVDLCFGQDDDQTTLQLGLRSILSLCNSFFILLSLPDFKYIPERIEPLIKSKMWIYLISVPFGLAIAQTLTTIFLKNTTQFIHEMDVYYALLTLGFLGSVLWTSFINRRLPMLAYLSIICIVITLVAQLYKMTDSTIDENLFSAIFKSCLIMLFFALALSWVKELMENVIPEARHIVLSLINRKTEEGQYQKIAAISGITSNRPVDITLTQSSYDLLDAFITARQTDSWLEIKPKSDIRSQKTYDINDHNQIKRLLNNLLDELFGKGAWTQNHHYTPLRSTLFEMSDKRDRKIRLALPKENISKN